jgi:starch synthase
MPRLRVLFVVSECVPFAKTGGLADVAGALPIALSASGHDVRVVMPRYRMTKKHPAKKLPISLGVPVGHGEAWGGVYEARLGESAARVYLLEHDELYDRPGIYNDAGGDYRDNLARFSFLSRGALRLANALGFKPDVVHVHDWPACLAPIYMKTLEAHTPVGAAASVLSIHNMGYQGWFDKSELYQTGLGWDLFHPRALESYDRLNLLKGGIYFSTMLSTVSPRYAHEIQTPEGGHGLDVALHERGNDVIGILNGIDDEIWNPATDRHLRAHFDDRDLRGKAFCKAELQREMGLPVRPDVPLIGIVSRLVNQKGIDVFAGALPRLLANDVQVVVLGSGESWAESLFSRLSAASDKFKASLGMNEGLSHRIEAGCDLFVMPSRYEPCGLNQLYSQRYGTLPVVRAVGGLDDTVDHMVTGFKFRELSPDVLAEAILGAVYLYREHPDQFRAMQVRAMRKPFGWQHASRQYEALYRLAMARHRGSGGGTQFI